MMTLYFDVLVQNYSCLRIVSYFSSKIGLGEIPLVADFEDTLYDDFAFWAKTTVVCEQFRILAVGQGLGEIPLVADFEDQLYAEFAFWRFWPKTTVVCETFHILAAKQGSGKMPLVADFEDQLYDDFAF